MGVFLKIEGEFPDDRPAAINTSILVAYDSDPVRNCCIPLSANGAVVITDFVQNYVLLSVATILVSIYAVIRQVGDNIVAKVGATWGAPALILFRIHKSASLSWYGRSCSGFQSILLANHGHAHVPPRPETSKRVMTWNRLHLPWAGNSCPCFGEPRH